jgi:hypothetical protein
MCGHQHFAVDTESVSLEIASDNPQDSPRVRETTNAVEFAIADREPERLAHLLRVLLCFVNREAVTLAPGEGDGSGKRCLILIRVSFVLLSVGP